MTHRGISHVTQHEHDEGIKQFLFHSRMYLCGDTKKDEAPPQSENKEVKDVR